MDWSHRTSLERSLITSVAILGIAVIVYTVVTIHLVAKKAAIDVPASEKLCLTPGCIRIANDILSYMDMSVDPCADFYNFACGKFLKESIIPEEKSEISSFGTVNDDLDIQLRKTFEEAEEKESPPKYESLVKKMYNSCRDEEAIELAGLEEMKRIIEDLGGWPMIKGNRWVPSINWQSIYGKVREFSRGANYIIQMGVMEDFKEAKIHRLQIDQADSAIALEFLTDSKHDNKVKFYSDYMTSVVKLFDPDNEKLAEELEKVVEFEKKLANISLKNEERRDYDKMYNLMTVKEIQQNFPVIKDWRGLINSFLKVDTIRNDDKIIVMNPDYYKKLGTVLDDVRTIHNYIIWRLVMDLVPYLPKSVIDAQLAFYTEMQGITARPKRWKECVSMMSDQLPVAVGSLYVQKNFNERARSDVQVMIKDISETFRGIMKRAEWMDDMTRKSALEKESAMTKHIGYPDELNDATKVDAYYENLTFIETDSFLKMHLRRAKFIQDNWVRKLRQIPDNTFWTHHANAAIVNAGYNVILNSIEFPAGILQGVFYDSDRPRYMNYGAIGYVIGHEMTHGFDDEGGQFNKYGKLSEWWDQGTKKAFRERADCIVRQYNNYLVEGTGLNVNGNTTQGENIADNGGIKEAYLAYKTSVVRDGKEPRLPGLQNYTSEQMFWIAASSVWCVKYKKEALILRVATGVHPIERFRVIGPMSNLNFFAEDFKCPLGSPMNPKDKCVVW